MNAAVVLMAYGSPDRLDDVPAYYADIRGGRPIAPEHLADLVERYRRLGIEESNPLNEITEATRAALETALGQPVFTGMRHWRPRIPDAVERALAGGADEIVGLVLAPHYSSMSIERYRAQLVGDDRGVQGNLDGAVLFGPWERIEAATLDVLARAAGRPGHIFNLGHGVMPDTDPDVLGRLRAFVHEQTARVPA